MIKKILTNIGFSEKESQTYLTLLELGNQPAANIAKRTNIPKSTTLFILENLVKRGYVQKSKKGITQFFYADPQDLKTAKDKEHTQEQEAIKMALPILKNTQNKLAHAPKTSFFEGV